VALIKCPECNKDVSTLAASCPNCGCPVSVAIPKELKLTQGVGGMELNTSIQETFRLCVEAAGKLSQKHIPKFIAGVDEGIIFLESKDTHGGWFDPVLYYDKIFIKPVAMSAESTLITNFHYEPATRADVSERVWVGFLNELHHIITN